MKRLASVGVVLLAAAVMSGCGIVIQSTAQPIAVSSHQFHVGAPGPSSRSGREVDVYFLSDNHLVAAARYVTPELTQRTLLQDTLNWLVTGPTTAELRSGVSTALSLSPSPQVSITDVSNGVVSLNLDKSFAGLDATQLYDSDAQIVYTLTQFAGITTVVLIFEGVREAWLPGGGVVYAPVDRSDYRSLAPVAK